MSSLPGLCCECFPAGICAARTEQSLRALARHLCRQVEGWHVFSELFACAPAHVRAPLGSSILDVVTRVPPRQPPRPTPDIQPTQPWTCTTRDCKVMGKLAGRF